MFFEDRFENLKEYLCCFYYENVYYNLCVKNPNTPGKSIILFVLIIHQKIKRITNLHEYNAYDMDGQLFLWVGRLLSNEHKVITLNKITATQKQSLTRWSFLYTASKSFL